MNEDVIHVVELENTMSEAQARALVTVGSEVLQERMRQHAKWGEQNWPDFPNENDLRLRAKYYGLPTEQRAKDDLEAAFRAHGGTFGHILTEEVAEAFGTKDKAELRAELIQVAAVAQAWVEKIDRDLNTNAGGRTQ